MIDGESVVVCLVVVKTLLRRLERSQLSEAAFGYRGVAFLCVRFPFMVVHAAELPLTSLANDPGLISDANEG